MQCSWKVIISYNTVLCCFVSNYPWSLLLKTFQYYTNVITHKQVSKLKMCGAGTFFRLLSAAFCVAFLNVFKRAHFNSICADLCHWKWLKVKTLHCPKVRSFFWEVNAECCMPLLRKYWDTHLRGIYLRFFHFLWLSATFCNKKSLEESYVVYACSQRNVTIESKFHEKPGLCRYTSVALNCVDIKSTRG